MVTRKFTKLNCAPKSKYKYTCYSRKKLKKIKHIYNKKNKTNKINKKTKKGIWKSLKHTYKNSCFDEKCWLNKLDINDNKLDKSTFAPDSPEEWINSPNAWLSTIDIEKVLKQYEKKYKQFVNLAISPSDYDTVMNVGQCVDEKLCKFNLNNYLNKKIGIVFNLDPHYKDGSHWVALYIYPKKRILYYFDSTGEKPTRHISRFIKLVQKQGISLNIPFKYKYNTLPHQKKNTECGIYVLYFLIKMLKSKDPQLFTRIIDDSEISRYRNIYFNKSKCKVCNMRECIC
jgi:hypothetical protein